MVGSSGICVDGYDYSARLWVWLCNVHCACVGCTVYHLLVCVYTVHMYIYSVHCTVHEYYAHCTNQHTHYVLNSRPSLVIFKRRATRPGIRKR